MTINLQLNFGSLAEVAPPGTSKDHSMDPGEVDAFTSCQHLDGELVSNHLRSCSQQVMTAGHVNASVSALQKMHEVSNRVEGQKVKLQVVPTGCGIIEFLLVIDESGGV